MSLKLTHSFTPAEWIPLKEKKKKFVMKTAAKNIYRNGERVEKSNVLWMQTQSNTLTLSLSKLVQSPCSGV